jgi:hypothetical protein
VPSQAAEAADLSTALGVPIGVRVTHAIPRIIHRFWTGGPMRAGAFRNLVVAGDLARQAGWQSHLWYSTTVEELVDPHLGGADQERRAIQREALERVGYSIGFIEGLAPAARRGAVQLVTEEDVVAFARVAGRAAQRRDFDIVKYLSDLARLLYLNAIGGFHIDVDMALGDMDLGAVYHHNDAAGEVPLLGTLARDSTNRDVVRRLDDLRAWRRQGRVPRAEYREHVEYLAHAAWIGSGMYNGLIASRPRTTHLQIAIREYLVRARAAVKTGDLPTGMAVQPFLLCGQGSRQHLEQAMKESVPPYLLRLDQITAESDIGAGVVRR